MLFTAIAFTTTVSTTTAKAASADDRNGLFRKVLRCGYRTTAHVYRRIHQHSKQQAQLYDGFIMAESALFPTEFHWLQEVARSLDIGLVVLDLDFRVALWNGLMENHYHHNSGDVFNKTLFERFNHLSESGFRQKVCGVFQFKGHAFSTCEQRPYLFRMNHYRPFTSPAKFM